MGDEQLLTIAEAAQRVNLTRSALRRAINRKELEAVKLCSRIRISPAALERWITSGKISS